MVLKMDVTELHDEENLLVQMQDRWENYGSQDWKADLFVKGKFGHVGEND